MPRWFYLVIAIIAPLLPPQQAQAQENKPLRWLGYVYGGESVTDNYTAIFRQGFTSLDDVDSYLIALGGGKELHHWEDYLTLEAEGQVAQHFNGINDHTEVNSALNLRWQALPWDRWLDTSLAWGLGLSYAFSTPKLEVDQGDRVSNLMIFMNTELEVMVPGQEDWSVFTRIHHRSSAFGLINNADATANALVGGVRVRF